MISPHYESHTATFPKQVAFETCVLGRLRSGYRVLRMRDSSLGTRIELCVVLVRITTGAMPHMWATPREWLLRERALRRRISCMESMAEQSEIGCGVSARGRLESRALAQQAGAEAGGAGDGDHASGTAEGFGVERDGRGTRAGGDEHGIELRRPSQLQLQQRLDEEAMHSTQATWERLSRQSSNQDEIRAMRRASIGGDKDRPNRRRSGCSLGHCKGSPGTAPVTPVAVAQDADTSTLPLF